MPDPITQADRLIAVETTLGPDVLLLRSFSGTEGMSQLFHYHLDMLSEEFNIDFDQIVGQNATIGIKLDEAGSFRYINGFVSRFSQLPVEGHLARYEAVVVLRRVQSWIKVSLPNSNVLEGWIHSSLLTADSK